LALGFVAPPSLHIANLGHFGCKVFLVILKNNMIFKKTIRCLDITVFTVLKTMVLLKQ
jgi:hypothetical protein